MRVRELLMCGSGAPAGTGARDQARDSTISVTGLRKPV